MESEQEELDWDSRFLIALFEVMGSVFESGLLVPEELVSGLARRDAGGGGENPSAFSS